MGKQTECNWVRQAIRGCGTLPHVGSHPGTPILFFFVALGSLAGIEAGWQGAFVGAGLMLIFVGAAYLCGAASRANLSDHIERRKKQPPSEA